MSILTMPFPSSLRAATTSPLRSLAAVTVPTAPILNRKKPTPARLAPNGRFWINACYSPPRCSVLISKMKLSKMMTGLTRNTVRNASKAMRYPWQGISLPAWQVIGGYTQQKSNHQKRQDVAQDGSSSLPYTPEHAFTLWSQYQATDDISVGAGARYIGSMHKGSDGAVGTPALLKVTGSPTPNWGIGLIAISTSS
ncbi:catecholate siderophore TonB-dependent receptor [Escherichia coli]|nr:catecholate siderophore TonB-dependent receptor [Escherichia coli]